MYEHIVLIKGATNLLIGEQCESVNETPRVSRKNTAVGYYLYIDTE